MSSEHIPEGKAALLLRRAAALQLEAATQAEQPPEAAAPAERAEDGYSLEELTEAASEAGIDPEFVTRAMRELDDPGAQAALARATPAHEATLTRWLGSTKRSITVTRIIEADADRAWDATARALEDPTVGFRFVERIGPPLLEGGHAVYAMPSFWDMYTRTGHYTRICYECESLELRKLQASIRTLSGARCEVTLFADLRPGAEVNLTWARRGSGIAAGFGAVVGGGLTFAALGPTLLAMLVVPILGAGVLAGGWAALFRQLYPRAAQRLQRELDALLDRVQRDVSHGRLLRATPSEDEMQ